MRPPNVPGDSLGTISEPVNSKSSRKRCEILRKSASKTRHLNVEYGCHVRMNNLTQLRESSTLAMPLPLLELGSFYCLPTQLNRLVAST